MNHKILIVDDEADIALILKLQLEDAGYRTVRAKDGVEALEKLAREEFDLVLLDIKMPRLDGMAVLEQMGTLRRTEAVVMMTAHGNEDLAVAAIKQGAHDYVAKPFSTEDILRKVEQAIRFNRTQLHNLRLQENLEDERKKMEAILHGMADLVVAVDGRGNIMTLNRRAEEVLSLAFRDAEGQPVAQVITADIPPDQLPCLVALRSGQPCLDLSYTLHVGDRRIPVQGSATPLFGTGGAETGAVEIIRDISRLKALEQDKEDFVSMLSHDLKSPITSIVGSLDLVRDGRLGVVNEEQVSFLGEALESCDEMVEMIDTMLDVYKFEAGKMTLTFRREDPRHLLERALAKYQSVAIRSGHKISLETDGGSHQIQVDRSKFTRLLNNLLSNAVKFTPEGGSIAIRSGLVRGADAAPPLQLYPGRAPQPEGRYLLITVTDMGIGIHPESLASIFDRYEQAKNRRQGKTHGTGLGLTFCRKVMDAHNGFIWAESTEGKGSTFYLLFPSHDAEP